MIKYRFAWHRLRLWVVLIGLASFGAAATTVTERSPLRPPSRAAAEDAGGARVIVKYKVLGRLMRSMQRAAPKAPGPQQAAAMSRRVGLALRDGRVVGPHIQVLRGGAELTSAELAARLSADDEVEYAVPDRRRYPLALTPNDPLFLGGNSFSPQDGQWYLRAPTAVFVSATNAVNAWNFSTGSPAIVVADLDTGVRFDHPDLAGKLYPGYDFITDLADAADGNGRDSDATDPGDWTTANQCDASTDAADSSWHGTQTAGLIGARTNNGIGMASVGRDVMVLPVRVLGKCGGTDSDIIAAMLWAGGLSSSPVVNTHPARVINMSLGASGACSAAYRDALTRLNAAGVVVVASAGNDEGLAVGSPANCAGVIAVGGLRNVGTKVGFSSLGPEVAISAPAGNCVNSTGACLYPILTTTNAGTQGASASAYTDSANISVGTSFSSPLVAGAAALMLSINPALTPQRVRSLLQSTARPFPINSYDDSVPQCRPPTVAAQDECRCTTSTCGAGMLDAAAAVAAAVGTPAPVVRVTPAATSVVAGVRLRFDGGASMAAGGRAIVSYHWIITSGTSAAAIAGSNEGPAVEVATIGIGTFTLQLTVTDSASLQANATATGIVNAAAAPAVQLLVSATAVEGGAVVTFEGNGSTAAPGLSIANYNFNVTSGRDLVWVSGFGYSTFAVTALDNTNGNFTVTLTVTDSIGQRASTSQTVSVTSPRPIASLAASAVNVIAGTSVDFDATASVAPPGRSIGNYEWVISSVGGIASFSGSTTGPRVAVATRNAGSFTVQLTVTDSKGAKDTKTASVSVVAAGDAGPSSSGSSGGGGAAGGGWLEGLALAVLALAFAGPRRGERGAQLGRPAE